MYYFLAVLILSTTQAFAELPTPGQTLGTVDVSSNWYDIDPAQEPVKICAEVLDIFNRRNTPNHMLGKLEYDLPVNQGIVIGQDGSHQQAFSCRIRVSEGLP
jgi:hypothetical protein